ncbi:MAG: hypothetical protein JWO02_413 [Solirubrobacterales bacterium]|nr:hypothetical protein [Solirubrobacterales bacterium]
MADDDALMHRFEKNARRFNARDAILTVFFAAFVLVLIQGNSMTRAGERLKPGLQRDVVLAVGKPAGWIADQLPLHTVAHDLTAGLSPDTQLSKEGGFDTPLQAGAGAANQVPLVTPDAFAPATIGAKPGPKVPLKTLLITGDSLSQPLDTELGRALAGGGVKVVRDAKLGSGISKTDIVDWGRLAVTQTKNDQPDAVIMFMGANEGFPMKGTNGKDMPCCSAAWASIYANRARQMMNTYRRGGRTHIYWLKIPAQRKPGRQAIARVVNAAITVAAQPWGNQVTVFDTNPTFTPGGKYRDAMDIGGKETIVRKSDGIHLNEAGSALLAKLMVAELRTGFDF